MIRKIVHRLGAPVVCVLMMSGCSVLDNIELSGNGAVYDPNKIYLRNEFFTVRNRRTLSIILMCRSSSDTSSADPAKSIRK